MKTGTRYVISQTAEPRLWYTVAQEGQVHQSISDRRNEVIHNPAWIIHYYFELSHLWACLANSHADLDVVLVLKSFRAHRCYPAFQPHMTLRLDLNRRGSIKYNQHGANARYGTTFSILWNMASTSKNFQLFLALFVCATWATPLVERLNSNTSCSQPTTQHLSAPPYENYFYSDCNSASQVVVTSPIQGSNLTLIGPRLLVSQMQYLHYSLIMADISSGSMACRRLRRGIIFRPVERDQWNAQHRAGRKPAALADIRLSDQQLSHGITIRRHQHETPAELIRYSYHSDHGIDQGNSRLHRRWLYADSRDSAIPSLFDDWRLWWSDFQSMA